MTSDQDVTNDPSSDNSSPTRNQNPQIHSTSSSAQTSSSDNTAPKSGSKHAQIIYTPASTVTSSKGSSACDEIVADAALEAVGGWPEEWCQLLNFASDIGQIKELLSRQSSSDDDANVRILTRFSSLSVFLGWRTKRGVFV